MPARALTPAQRRENAAFLAALARTGNAREAARRVGAHRAKFTKRRAKHAEFAAQWEAALAQAQEHLAGDPFAPGLTHLADGRLQLRPPRDPDFAQAWRTALFGAAIRLEEEMTGSISELTQEEKVELFGGLFSRNDTA